MKQFEKLPFARFGITKWLLGIANLEFTSVHKQVIYTTLRTSATPTADVFRVWLCCFIGCGVGFPAIENRFGNKYRHFLCTENPLGKEYRQFLYSENALGKEYRHFPYTENRLGKEYRAFLYTENVLGEEYGHFRHTENPLCNDYLHFS